MTLEEKILSDAKSLFMRYGLRSVTMDDIAKHLGISKKTIYQYVDHKKDLINKILVNHTNEETCIVDRIQDGSKDAIDEILRIAKYVILQLSQLSPNTIYDLQKYYQQSYQIWESFHQEVVFEVIKRNIVRGKEEGLYRSDLDEQFIAKIYIEMTRMLSDPEKFPMMGKQFDKMYKQFINYHVRGLVSGKGFKILNKYINKIPA